MGANNKILLILTITTLLLTGITSSESTQQYNKIYLEPHYKASLTANNPTNYTLKVNPPDNIKQVISAIIGFNAQINGQTQNFSIKINNQTCKTSSYSITTAFSTTGNIQFSFDCTNIINQTGEYKLTLQNIVNTGTITGWLELTYMNDPSGTANVQGTEYEPNDEGKVWLQLLDNNQQSINNGTCFTDIYYPDGTPFREKQIMTLTEDGVYQYDFTTPTTTGVYPVIAFCYYLTNTTTIKATTGTILEGINISGGLNSTTASDNIRWVISENGTYWWNTSYAKRINITINNTAGATLTNFPAYINLTKDADMQSDYDDLRFISGKCEETTGTILDYEIENASTTNAHIWIRIPSLTTGINNLCLYFGNTTATNGENKTGVWNTNYVYVHHLAERTGTHQDSTSRNNDATSQDISTQGSAVGAIDGADNFEDPSTDSITIPTTGLTTTAGTIEIWANIDNDPPFGEQRQYMFSHRTGTNNNRIYLVQDDATGQLQGGFANTFPINTGYTITLDTMNYYALTWSGGTYRILANGVLLTSGGAFGLSNIDASSYLGSFVNIQEYLDGILDEARLSNNQRSDAWINYTYQIVRNQTNLVKFSNKENFTGITKTATINQTFTFTNISTTELYTGITIGWEGQWNSTGDTIIIQVYNWSSNNWETQTNNITNTGGIDQTISNTMLFSTPTNITTTGIINSTGQLLLRLTDTNKIENDAHQLSTDHLYLQLTKLTGGTWQEVKGSSEIHITNKTQQIIDSITQQINNINTTITQLQQDITSLSQQNLNEYNALSQQIIDLQDNLTIAINQLNQELNNINISITQELNQTINNVLNDTWTITFTGTEYPSNANGTTALILQSGSGTPITNANCTITTYYPNQSIKGTSQATHLSDGVYYYNFNTTTIEGVYLEIANCTTTLPPKTTTSLHSYHVNPSMNWIQQILSYLQGYLTTLLTGMNETINNINSTTTNNSLKLDALLTPTINIATTDNSPCLTGEDWVINATTTGSYGQLLTNTQANCTIYTTIWGTSNMTYTSTGKWTYTNTCPTPDLWNWSITCT